MKLNILGLLIIFSVASCDTINDLAPSSDQSLDKIAMSLQSVYPQAGTALITTIEENQLWQASFKISNDNYTAVLNDKGSFLETLRSMETQEGLPDQINTLINQNYSDYKVSGRFARLKGLENIGYKLVVSNSESANSLVFDREGSLKLISNTPTSKGLNSSAAGNNEISTNLVSEYDSTNADITISFISVEYDELPESVKSFFNTAQVNGEYSSSGIELIGDVKTYLVWFEAEGSFSTFMFDADGNSIEQNISEFPELINIVSGPSCLEPSAIIDGLNPVELPEGIANYLDINYGEGDWELLSADEMLDENGDHTGYQITIDIGTEMPILLKFDTELNLMQF